MEKIPCIICTSKRRSYIEPYLKEWGYIPTKFISCSPNNNILILNWGNSLGKYDFGCRENLGRYNRELITDVEEFLERAAKLMNKTYKRKDMNTIKINGIEIKPGMVIMLGDNTHWVVFPMENGLAVIEYENTSWYHLDSFMTKFEKEIKIIFDKSKGSALITGNKLWEKPKKVQLSKKEIAKKFNINPEQIEFID